MRPHVRACLSSSPPTRAHAALQPLAKEAGARHDEQAVCIGGDDCDERSSAVDPGSFQALVGRCVIVKRNTVRQREVSESPSAAVDDDEGDAGARELLAHEAAHPTVATDDDVIFERAHCLLQPLSSHHRPQFAARPRAKKLGPCEEHREDAAERERHRKNSPARRQRMHLPEADRRQRDDRHVERIEERPAFDEMEPEHPHQHENGRQNRDQPHAAMHGGSAPVHRTMINGVGGPRGERVHEQGEPGWVHRHGERARSIYPQRCSIQATGCLTPAPAGGGATSSASDPPDTEHP